MLLHVVVNALCWKCVKDVAGIPGAMWRSLCSRQEILASSRAFLILDQEFLGKWFISGCILMQLHVEVISASGHASQNNSLPKLCEIAVINMRAQLEVPCRNGFDVNSVVLQWAPQPLAPLSPKCSAILLCFPHIVVIQFGLISFRVTAGNIWWSAMKLNSSQFTVHCNSVLNHSKILPTQNQRWFTIVVCWGECTTCCRHRIEAQACSLC